MIYLSAMLMLLAATFAEPAIAESLLSEKPSYPRISGGRPLRYADKMDDARASLYPLYAFLKCVDYQTSKSPQGNLPVPKSELTFLIEKSKTMIEKLTTMKKELIAHHDRTAGDNVELHQWIVLGDLLEDASDLKSKIKSSIHRIDSGFDDRRQCRRILSN